MFARQCGKVCAFPHCTDLVERKGTTMTTIFVRTIFFYVALIVIMRIMGKRQIGEMQVTEFVCAVMLSELAAVPITDFEIPVTHGLIPIFVIGALEIVSAYLSMKFPKVGRIIDGKSIMLVHKGKYIYKNLEKTRISVEEVDSQIRINGYKGIWEVDTIILEKSGNMSVLPKAGKGGS